VTSLAATARAADSGRRYTILYHHRTKALDGQRVHIREIQDALRADGHRVVEVSVLRSTEVAGAMPAKTWRRSLFGKLQAAAPFWAGDLLEYLYNPVGWLALVRAAWRTRPDFIYERYALNSVAGIWAARTLGVPLLLEVNSPLATERDARTRLRLGRVAHAIERYVIRRATRVLPVSSVLSDMIVRDAGIDGRKTDVIHNGVDVRRFEEDRAARAAIRDEIGAGNRVVIGAVAFFLPWHGVDRLLRVVADNQTLRANVMVLLVGEGPAIPSLRQFVEERSLGDVVRFAGAVPHDRVPSFLSAIDVAVLPRATPYASPLKLFEYMAAGKAVVAPRQANVLEVAMEGSEILCCRPDDDQELERQLGRLVADAGERERLGAAARARILRDDRTWRANARRIVRAYEQILTRTAGTLAPARQAETL
jgi:glycosyltransferase involved in cell wall biosynthesis